MLTPRNLLLDISDVLMRTAGYATPNANPPMILAINQTSKFQANNKNQLRLEIITDMICNAKVRKIHLFDENLTHINFLFWNSSIYKHG